jgi:hypothetical protein
MFKMDRMDLWTIVCGIVVVRRFLPGDALDVRVRRGRSLNFEDERLLGADAGELAQNGNYNEAKFTTTLLRTIGTHNRNNLVTTHVLGLNVKPGKRRIE